MVADDANLALPPGVARSHWTRRADHSLNRRNSGVVCSRTIFRGQRRWSRSSRRPTSSPPTNCPFYLAAVRSSVSGWAGHFSRGVRVAGPTRCDLRRQDLCRTSIDLAATGLPAALASHSRITEHVEISRIVCDFPRHHVGPSGCVGPPRRPPIYDAFCWRQVGAVMGPRWPALPPLF
jgi:hypothetical protein